ncbi:MAG TPA: hypothetical protein VIL69_02720 [Roseomonas sp.]|jgi:hypothetical protein
MAAHPDDYAIVISIDDYPGLNQAVPDATARARELAAWLTAAQGGGVPAENLRLLHSGGATAETRRSEPYPQLAQVDRALASVGGGAGGTRAGRRLYGCFVGCANGHDAESLALLLADAGLTAAGPTALCLRTRREYLRRAVPFDEFVLIADVRLVPTAAANIAPPPFALPDSRIMPGRTLRELELVGDGVIPALLDELRSVAQAGGGDWRLDSPELVERLTVRMGATLVEARQVETIAFGHAAPEPVATGSLLVELPHWTTRVRILDRLLRPIQITTVRSIFEPIATEHALARVELPPGAYTVELTLGGTTVRRSVTVPPGRETRLTHEAWTSGGSAAGRPAADADAPATAPPPASAWRALPGLRLAAATPIADTSTMREWHRDPAIYYSRQVTWIPDAPAQHGDAGLFVFVRTLEPQRFPRFAEGIALLDADGTTVLDLTGPAVMHNSVTGYLAFRALLRPGAYLLRRGPSAEPEGRARPRYQPLHLCAGWDTQVFIPAEDAPSLRLLELGIVPTGAGFDPESQAAAATLVLFDALRTGGTRAAAALAMSDALLPQLPRLHAGAPWLGVLAAHALRDAATAGPEGPPDGEAAGLLTELLHRLNADIGDHPDVRALSLLATKPAAAPFPHPPMLRASLALVQRHATRFRSTIPYGSLTDRVLDTGIANASWTAWREPAADEAARHGGPARAATLSAISPVGLLAETLTPKAPVLRVPDPAASPVAAAVPSPTARVEEALSDLPLVAAAQQVAAALDAIQVPPPTLQAAVPAQLVQDLLARVRPARLSAATGLPLARIRQGIDAIRQVSASAGAGLFPVPPGLLRSGPEATAAEVVMGHALRQSEAAQPAAGAPRGMAPPPPMSAEAVVSSPTIEASARTLLIGAARIRRALTGGRAAGGDAIAVMLEELAQKLCKHADFVATTDTEGRLRNVNGVLAMYLAMSSIPEATRQALENTLRLFSSAATDAAAPSDSDAAVPVAISPVVRIAVETEGVLLGFVGVLRDPGAGRLPEGILPAIDAVLSRLNLYASLLVREATRKSGADAAREADYTARLNAIIGEIHDLLNPHRSPAAAVPTARASHVAR